jgi:hypothetical protein
MLAVLEEGVRKARAEGALSDGPYSYNWLSRHAFRLIQPPVTRKFRAPKSFRPGASQSIEAERAEWDRTHDALERVVRDSNGLDLERVKVRSPVTRLIRYNLGMAFWIQTAHDRRHLSQAREIRNAPGFPA